MSFVHTTLYTAYTLLTLPARLLTWWLYYIPKSNRPNPNWSWRTTVTLQVIILVFRYRTAIRYRTPKSLEPGPDGDRFIVMNPQSTIADANLKTESAVYQGTLTSVPLVKPEPIGAVCAYVLFGPRPGDGTGWGPTTFSESSGWPILSVQYRLSLDADKTFPAAIQDGITAYIYALETLKIPPSQIVLSGESAGGNLILAMLQYITEENPAIPLPRCALLWSPWVDMTQRALNDMVKHRNYNSDYIKHDLGVWAVSSYIPPGWADDHPYLSPLASDHVLKLSIPLFIEVGTSEVLYDDIVQFALNMKKNGTEVELREALHGVHSTFGIADNLGMPEVAIEGHKQAAKFIARAGEELE
ncbi:Alpha/Beta hydrolase protein [Penicillium malachiteum]|uniref:Alpha/Beta hydrolase protein n=1 Tax=Penicillium malachiteum TaxID=1324776 RepID=UPI002547337B|nr:Alpha/Beta hydrolase protein [Penicillium malachiteum]KAJ5729228.1 Alpha/Beta hydrolase protein [Penicillium malachiteum]